MFEKMPDSVCTVSSTGVNQIRGEFKEHIIFGPSYETSYVYDGIYYAALRLADHLGIYHICVSGVNEIQLHYLAELCPEFSGKFSVSREKAEGPCLCFTGDLEEEDVRIKGEIGGKEREEGAEGILYLNEKKGYRMKSFEKMIPVSVREGERQHTIFFQSGKEEMRKMAAEFWEEIKLPYLEEEIVIEKLNDDQMKIRMLEGILEATQKRLLEYIRREKELKSKISALEGKVKRDVGEP